VTDPLFGVWKLQSFLMTDQNGKEEYPFGVNPVGFLAYLPHGYMIVTLGSANRPNLPVDSLRNAAPDELILNMVQTYNSYCGRYEIKNTTVYHHVELCMFPNWTGTILERQFEIDGNILVHRNQLQDGPIIYDFVAKWILAS
jgi:hypothetical protein